MYDESSSYLALLQRGALLLSQRRYAEAAVELGRAIEAEPNKAAAYVELASCYNEWPGHEREALRAIDHAIGLEPNHAGFHGIKGWILVCQRKYPAALRVSQQAVALDPVDLQALNALTNAHTKMGHWKQAEEVARRILALYPNDIPALNLLSQALRLQGKTKESREIVATILARLPNNAFGHTNAGYGALAAGDHLRANEHFLTALRMEPHSDFARRGLLHSLRARVWIFRQHYRWAAFARQPAGCLRVLGLVGVMVALIVGLVFLNAWSPFLTGVLVGLALMYFYLSIFSFVLGDIFLLFDPMGRHALGLNEKWRARFICVILALIVYGFITSRFWIGLAFIVSSLLFFGLSIHYPQLKDRWQRWRENSR